MPMQRDLYPEDWEAIAHMVKEESQWHCEQCSKPCIRPDESFDRYKERMIRMGVVLMKPLKTLKPASFTLSVAHLDHNPANCDRTNLKALCTPCHCRYDLSQMPRKRQLKRERNGQLRLEGL